jgi:hypothetical protein
MKCSRKSRGAIVGALLSLVGLTTVLWAETPKVGAYIQFWYSADQTKPDEFNIKRARISLKGKLNELMSYYTEFDTMSPGRPITYTWVDLNFCPEAKLRIGRLYYPFGIEYTTPPSKYDTINVTKTFDTYFGGTKDFGIQLSGEVEQFKYALAVVNGNEGKFSDDNEKKDVVVHLVFTPVKGLDLGASRYEGRKGDPAVDNIRTGGELSLSYDPLYLEAEYAVGKDDKTESEGWYVQIIYKVNPKLEGLVKYENWDPDVDIADDKINVTTLGLNHYFDGGKLSVNYEIHSEEKNETENDKFITQLQINL